MNLFHKSKRTWNGPPKFSIDLEADWLIILDEVLSKSPGHIHEKFTFMDRCWDVILYHIYFTCDKLINQVKVKVTCTYSCCAFKSYSYSSHLKVKESGKNPWSKKGISMTRTIDVRPDPLLQVRLVTISY